MVRSAKFDSTKIYRYSLGRQWDSARGQLVCILLNPSTADHRQDDPTIRRCVGFGQRLGFGSMEVVNLFAFRATLPTDLLKEKKPVGPRNNQAIFRACQTADMILVGWGVSGTLNGRDQEVLQLLKDFPLHCLGTTREGHPRHPLYLKYETRPLPFPG